MIREAVPEKHVIVSVNTNGSLTQGYILPAGVCGCGVYQDKIAVVRIEAVSSASPPVSAMYRRNPGCLPSTGSHSIQTGTAAALVTYCASNQLLKWLLFLLSVGRDRLVLGG